MGRQIDFGVGHLRQHLHHGIMFQELFSVFVPGFSARNWRTKSVACPCLVRGYPVALVAQQVYEPGGGRGEVPVGNLAERRSGLGEDLPGLGS